jgi:hypothetical protein
MMAFITYKVNNFQKKSLTIIDQANSIIDEYLRDGYDLTLRQLYYQFVARGFIPNSDREYKKLGSVINDARLAGLVDWEAIIDRTRPSRGIQHWDRPQEIISTIGRQFHIDTRADQECYLEVWVEKDALIGVLEQVCDSLDVPYFSCRGYVSQSSMWEAAQRFIDKEEKGKETYLIHLGDHDPSGIDMSRDIQERLGLFESNCEVVRIALTMEQVGKYNPPPNPAKITDSRCSGYVSEYGSKYWELDALDPRTITKLIKQTVDGYTDEDKRDNLIFAQEMHRENIQKVAQKWDSIVKKLK